MGMNNTIIYVTLLLATIALGSCSNADLSTQANENNPQNPQEAIAQAEPFSYEDYALILSQYVDNQGLVDYSELKENRILLLCYHSSQLITTVFLG